MARLIHLNGAPGTGKSTLARRYVDDHPLALLLEVDALRISLGRWHEVDESMLVARTLALALAEAHLGAGHDVVVPQYLGRIDFVLALEDVARRVGADFVEILLEADLARTVERFRQRRRELVERGDPHPQVDVAEAAIEATLVEAHQRLAALTGDRPDVARVAAGAELDHVYAAVIANLAGDGRGARPGI